MALHLWGAVQVLDLSNRYAAAYQGDLSGMVYRDEDRVVIGVNSLDHPNRQRFTIAHELGHLMLHKGKEVFVDRTYQVNRRDDVSSRAVDSEEIEANRFAAELLVPPDMMRRDLEGRTIDFENDEEIRQLAKRYRVSRQAILIRISNIFDFT